jgi:peptidoglycan hydrolase CwlO-like protein
MTEPQEAPKPQPKPENTFDMKLYTNRFKEAVADAQIMLDYAATNTKSVIDPGTLKKLITARHIIENGKDLSAEEETDFWIAYQDLWEIVSPATAESIKANLSIEETFMSRLIGYIPGLSRWLGVGMTSKARSTVNRYIAFTVFVLVFLLFFQIYWVVGNQLITEMGVLSQREDFLKSQLAESAANPDAQPSQASLTADLQILESKHERYAAILWLWSKPWNGYINVIRKDHVEEFAPRFQVLDAQIAEIQNKIKDDPDGTKEAKNNAQQKNLEAQLAAIEKSLAEGTGDKAELERERDKLNAQMGNIALKNTLDSDLTKLAVKEADIQGQIDTLKGKQVEDENLINTLTADGKTVQEQITSLTPQLDYLTPTITDLQTTSTNIDTILNSSNISVPTAQASATTPAAPTVLTDGEMALLPAGIQADLKAIPDITGQLAYLQTAKQNIDAQISYLFESQKNINTQLQNLNAQKSSIQAQISTLVEQVEASKADINILESDLSSTSDEIKSKTAEKARLEAEIEEFQGEVDVTEAKQIVDTREADLQKLFSNEKALSLEEQEYLDRTDSRPAQLAGQFVLNILQSYFLPILYGLLGASTSVLRSLSRQIKDVTFSEKMRIQHLLSISLGALAGIVVGWFSFLIDGNSSFLGSVSPLAIAFLVGFNIDPFFSRMDLIMKNENETSRAAVKSAASQMASKAQSAQAETPSGEAGNG